MRYPRLHDVFADVLRWRSQNGDCTFAAQVGLVERVAGKTVKLNDRYCEGFMLSDSNYEHPGLWVDNRPVPLPSRGTRRSAVWSLDYPHVWRELTGLLDPQVKADEQWPIPVPLLEIIKCNPYFLWNGSRAHVEIWKIRVFSRGQSEPYGIALHVIPLAIRQQQVTMLVAEFNGMDNTIWTARDQLDGDVIMAGRLVPGLVPGSI